MRVVVGGGEEQQGFMSILVTFVEKSVSCVQYSKHSCVGPLRVGFRSAGCTSIRVF